MRVSNLGCTQTNQTNFQAKLRINDVGFSDELAPAIKELQKMFAALPNTAEDTVLLTESVRSLAHDWCADLSYFRKEDLYPITSMHEEIGHHGRSQIFAGADKKLIGLGKRLLRVIKTKIR